jgi:hypothetical protein
MRLLQNLQSPLVEFSEWASLLGRRQFAAFARFCDAPVRRLQVLT